LESYLEYNFKGINHPYIRLLINILYACTFVLQNTKDDILSKVSTVFVHAIQVNVVQNIIGLT